MRERYLRYSRLYYCLQSVNLLQLSIANTKTFLQITFNPQGTRVLTASSDKTARIWDPETGECKQILEGHTDEIFSCAFNYEGNTIITGTTLFYIAAIYHSHALLHLRMIFVNRKQRQHLQNMAIKDVQLDPT